MYIAIVADNVADRKQAERLLDRANTALSPQLGTLYISSFGDETAFLHACMKFDLFLLDFDHDISHSLQVVCRLRQMNAPGIAVICRSDSESIPHDETIQDICTLDKPILTAPLHKTITDACLEVSKKRSRQKLIELRSEDGTHYVPKDDIMYVTIDDISHKLCYHLSTGEKINLIGTTRDMDNTLGSYEEFRQKLKNVCFNTNYISRDNEKSILLSNGERFSYPLLHRFFRDK